MRKFLFSVYAVLAILGCGGDNVDELPYFNSLASGSSSFVSCTDPVVSNGSVTCGGQTYKTIVIGTQTWMAVNLNYNAPGSKCYNNNLSYCDEYGRLYNWSTAMGFESKCNNRTCSSQIQSPHQGICPSGWHIPSSSDWGKLSRYIDGTSGSFLGYVSSTAGKHLKTTSGWNSGGNGTDQYSFSALPGGYGRAEDGSFDDVGNFSIWWSASENESTSYFAYNRYMTYDSDNAKWANDHKSRLFSVRCLKDGDTVLLSSSSSLVPSSSSYSSSSSNSSSSSIVSQSNVVYGSPVTYEGETYQTVVIGTQTWFARNLNYAPSSGTFISCDTYDCATYGRLYDWPTAMALPSSCNSNFCSSQVQSKHRGICPSGWHIPDNDDWEDLMSQVGGYNTAGIHLKAKSGWYDCGPSGSGSSYSCEDTWGFSALPGGKGYPDGSFSLVGNYGYWWNAGENEDGILGAYNRYMYYYYDYAYWSDYYDDISNLFSVRCIQD
ncbi:MAG: hypothetical protein LBQ87_06120 [Candidatus Fibromonas sp.]|jgi:uncharacterized protein (TIGR02145 family)|nr:hypothetical protein [Candidatus Fibromonas sp.]